MGLTSNVHGHFFDLSAVELFNFAHHAHIISRDKIDSNTFSSKTPSATDAVNVVLAIGWEIVVDDQRDLLNINATSEQVSRDQDTGRARSEFSHDDVSLALLHVAVHG